MPYTRTKNHLIINEERYDSSVDIGIMDQLKKSGLFKIMGPERKELEEWKTETERKQAKKRKAKEIAKTNKVKGL